MGKGPRATAGHMPLTHHERTKKFTIHSTDDSADYGTTSLRLAGHSQYQVGTCALTTQSLAPSSDNTSSSSSTATSTALCSPSGYIYDETSILEYLLLQTQQIKKRQQQQEQIKQQNIQEQVIQESNAKKRQIEQFHESQQIIQKSRLPTEQEKATEDLHRVSYWLSTAQPVVVPVTTTSVAGKNNAKTSISPVDQTRLALTNGDDVEDDTKKSRPNENVPSNVIVTTASNTVAVSTMATESTIPMIIPERPVSPMTGQPLARRDLWPIQLEWTTTSSNSSPKVKCAISDRMISNGAPVVAYWTTKQPHRHGTEKNHSGVMVLQSVYATELQLPMTTIPPSSTDRGGSSQHKNHTCPLTDRPIRHVRVLQRSGSSYAASGQAIMSASQYKPTIT